MKAILVALLALSAALAGCATPRSEPAPASGGWSFTTFEGETVTADAPARNATILFFMATWCTSCRAKAPILAEVAPEYASRGVATYSVDFDPSETREEVDAWKAHYAQEWPHGLDSDRAVQRALGVTTQSTVVVLDAQGEVVRKFGYGQVSAAELRAAVDEALARPA